MWEQIRSNKRKSVVLVVGMALLLMALGFIIGLALIPPAGGNSAGSGGAGGLTLNPVGGVLGLLAAFVIWSGMSLTAYFSGGKILLAASGAKRIEKKDHPQLYNVVEEMAIASGMGKLPDIYIIDDMALNAFATGRSPDNSAVAVTAGLLGKLNRDQLQGVIAHEMSHVVNRDVLFMTMIGVMVGSIVIISHVFLRGLFYGGARRRGRNTSSKGGGQAQAIMMIVAVVLAILAPILARLIYLAASRKREYLADASAAVLTRYPEGLASALEVISGDTQPLASANKATAPMFIANPFKKAKLSALSSTHPPIAQRIQVLRSIGGSVSYGAYQQAWKQIAGKKAGALPASALADQKELQARAAAPETAAKKNPREQMRQATDILRKANDYLFLSCLCGLRIKLPPEFKHDHVKCPRCSRDVSMPVAQMAAMREALQAAGGASAAGRAEIPAALEAALKRPSSRDAKAETLEVTRTGSGWMTFKCTCGSNVSISPTFEAPKTACPKCHKEIRVVNV